MDYKKGDKVTVTGTPYYTSYGGSPGKALKEHKGTVTYTNEREGVPYPVHVDQKGWFPLSAVKKEKQTPKEEAAAQTKAAAEKIINSTTIEEKKTLARRVRVSLVFQGNDISKSLESYLISCSFTDNAEDKADDLQIQIDDRDGKWLTWLQKETLFNIKGAKVAAVIIYENYWDTGKERLLDCGLFEVDTVSIDGPPQQLTIKATSISQANKIRNEKKNRAWEGYTLQGIAAEIAAKAGMQSLYLSGYHPSYQRKEQVSVSDILFLQSLAKDAGISVKVSSQVIILYDQAEFELKDAVYKIDRLKGGFLSYGFSTKSDDTGYKKAHVKYTNPKTKKSIEATYKLPGAKEDSQTLEITNVKVASKAEALKVAQKRLRAKNKGEYEASFTLPGDPNLVVGVNIQITGWGAFDGKYIVNQATHSITGGYTVALNMTRTMEGY